MSRTVSISCDEKEAVGSSRMMTLLRKTSALAISTIFCWPLVRSLIFMSGDRSLLR